MVLKFWLISIWTFSKKKRISWKKKRVQVVCQQNKLNSSSSVVSYVYLVCVSLPRAPWACSSFICICQYRFNSNPKFLSKCTLLWAFCSYHSFQPLPAKELTLCRFGKLFVDDARWFYLFYRAIKKVHSLLHFHLKHPHVYGIGKCTTLRVQLSTNPIVFQILVGQSKTQHTNGSCT